MSFAISQIDPPEINMAGACVCIHNMLLLAQTRLDVFARSLQLSADSSVIWLGGWGGCCVSPPCVVFGARWRPWRCCWYPWCIWIDVSRGKIRSMVMQAGSTVRQRCMCCVSWGWGVNVTLMPAFVAQLLLIGVVLSLKPAGLFVSGIAWLFLGGRDEPFCLLRLVRWCDRSVLHAKIQMSHI